MSFAENLKQIRKERGLTQENLAELMEVSRQAVSKWEQGEGYPEIEKLLNLASQLNVSLDNLMSEELSQNNCPTNNNVTGTIIITSPNENVVATCYKVISSQKMKGGKKSPHYALFGVSGGGNSFWGEATTFLGWYANYELISKEVNEIKQAVASGVPAYDLKYSAKVERKWLRVIMIDENIE